MILHMFKGENWRISSFEKKKHTHFNMGFFFFFDAIKARLFTLCMIITLLGVYIVF